MSSGLMSCVRENSPPLELEANESGALSLPETTMTAAAAATTSLAPMSPGAFSANCETATPTAEQQKRRRFHPLRNLRRIFRRRTITSADDSPAAEAVRKAKQQTTEPVAPTTIGSASEKNLRSATLSSISSVVSSSASSPSSPLAHQLLQTLHGNTNGSRSPVKSCSHGSMLLAPKSLHKLQQEQLQQQVQNQNKQLLNDTDAMYATNASSSIGSATTYHQRQQHAFNMSTVTSKSATNTALVTSSNELQSISALSVGHRSSTMGGVAVLPGAFNAAMSHSFFAERQKLKSLGDSSQELDSSANSSLGSSSRRVIGGNERNAVHVSANGSGGEMTDSQRSFSEGRLVDSDYSRDGLSQSHDSVFSESATASSLSIVLKAELADALRKRRNRPDASDEDLGLPRSPASPQRRSERNSAAAITTTPTTAGNQSDVSSLSMLSMNSTEGDSMLTDSTANATLNERSYTSMTSSKYSRNSTMNSSSSDILRPSSTPSKSEIFGEVDLFSSDWQRLSHSAAKHKMAVRPTKKKGPSRQHRRTLETSIPEANEDLFRISSSQLSDHTANKDARSNIQSTPPVASAKPQQQSGEKHLETKKQDTADEPRKNQIKSFEGKRGNDNKRSKMDVAKPEIAAKPSPSPSTTSFGLRTLTAKASAIFESRSDNQLNDEREKVEDNTKISQPVQQIETTESGFLRRLIQRNSKRTLPKATNFEDNPDSQSEPKKLQISTSVYEPRDTLLSSRLSQTQSAIAYDQQVEQTRKEIKREILSEAGLGVMLSPYLFTSNANDANPPRKPVPLTRDATTEAFQKPKSGPAARQRYLPQDILSSSSVEKTNPSASLKVPLTDTVSSITNTSLSKSGHEETFQSISIIREITATQSLSSAKSEHHLFEKKPKIIGLSAFQQKISRANESHLRSQSSISSSNSLEVKDEGFFLSSAEQKHRKSVEKSRSFRTYNADKELDLTNSVRSNMPSLPDLSLRLPTFNEFILNEKEYSSPSPPEYGDKCVSLGFEINDNNLVRPSSRAESASSLGKATCKLSAPTTTILPSLSPTNSCSNDISEIEQNIDKIVKSPYVSLMRKSATVSEEMSMKTPGSAKKLVEPTSRSEMHPNSVAQPKETKVIEPKASPTKTQHAAAIRNHTITIPEKLDSELSAVKEAERKSIAAFNPATASKISTNSRPRRSASVIESSTPDSTDTSIPEFLKIQLNRVDPGTRAPKSTVVLAKNVKESSTVVTKDVAERSVSNDDLSLRRYSTESLEIVENEKLNSPERPSIPLFEAINKQTKSLSTNSIQSSSTHSEPTPKTITIKKHPATPTSQTPPMLLNTANVNTAGSNNYSTGTTPTEEVVVLRHKPPIPTVETTATTTTTSANKLSLQERKRLFMNEDKTNADKKIEELKNERKKSISEELQRKSSCSGNNKIDLKESAAEESSTEKEPVIMRKKSFGVAQQTNALHTSINNINNNNNNNTTTSSSATNRDDATPELMKVFARRSLKVKDEDLVNLADKIISAPNSTSIALKKSTAGQSNVDSDKENQSASEEKLDKISKFETHGHLTAEQMNGKMLISNTASSISLGSSSVSSTRSSMTDFRSSVISYKNGGNGKALALNCNNNNNNSNNSNNINNSTHSNNNNNNSLNSTATLSTKCSLPSLRVGSGLRSLSNVNEQRSVSECVSNNNNINNHNNSQNSFNNQAKSSLERQSLCMRATTNVADSGSKTIERSATVGEFKGILQRRAEWEQRAKEALK